MKFDFIANMSKKQKTVAIAAISVVLALVIAFIALYSNGLSGIHHHKKAKEGQIKVACVGDSITYGHGVGGWAKNNYPAQLQKMLGEGYHVENFGVSGATLSPDGDKPYVETKQYKLALEYDADILVVMLGTNDSKPENFTSALDLIDDYKALIQSFRENNSDLKVIVCSPAKAFFVNEKSETTSFDIQPNKVTQIRNRVCSWTIFTPYYTVDIYELTENHPEWFEKDGVHPSKDGAKAIAELIAGKIKSLK